MLQKYCFDCHGDGVEKGGLALDQWKTAAARDADRHVWKVVLKNVSTSVMPPLKSKAQPSDKERAVIERWIERVVFHYDPDKPDPGRVTLRRLNRQEYNNTVRDLLFVDFKPANDFPPDDTGYGFDTIGDVLSLSPVLLEKYLNAAEQVMDAAIRTEDPPLPVRRYRGNQLRGPGGNGNGPRVLSSTGKVSVAHEFPADGEYLIWLRAGAEQAGREPARMTLEVVGKDLRTFDVKNLPDEMRNFEHRVRMKAGRHEVAAKFINDFYDPKARDPKRRDRNLFVGGIDIEGPLGVDMAPPPEFHQRTFGDLKVTAENRLAVTKRLLREFCSRAYRRKVPEAEIDRLMRFVKLGFDQGGEYAFERGIQVACQAVLVSPFFLYRGEVQPDPNNPEATYRIDEYALASRLS